MHILLFQLLGKIVYWYKITLAIFIVLIMSGIQMSELKLLLFLNILFICYAYSVPPAFLPT